MSRLGHTPGGTRPPGAAAWRRSRVVGGAGLSGRLAFQVGLLAWALWAAACGGATVDVAAEPRMAYWRAMEARLAVAQQTEHHTLRYNPTPCRCPPFEMLLDRRWVRVDLAVTDVDDPVLTALLAATRGAREREALRTYRVDGVLDDGLGRCAGGALFVTLRPAAFVPPPAAPPEMGQPLPAARNTLTGPAPP